MVAISKPCLALLKKLNPHASDTELKGELKIITDFVKEQRTSLPGFTDPQIVELANALLLRRQVDLKRTAHKNMINIRIKKEFNEYLAPFAPEDRKEAIVAFLVGANPLKLEKSGFFTKGSRKSIFSKQKFLFQKSMGEFENRLKTEMPDKDLFKIFRDAELDHDIRIGLYEEYYSRLPGAKKIESKVSPEARAISKIMYDIKLKLNNRYARNGSVINSHPSQMLRLGSHDQSKIPEDVVEWKQKILPLLSDETFKGVPNKIKFLDDLWVDLRSGTHIKNDGLEDNVDFGSGVKNINRIIFKNAESHIKYDEEFGVSGRHLSESFIYGMEHDSRGIALVDSLGPNPKAMLESLIRDTRSELRKTHGNIISKDFNIDTDKLTKFISNRFAELDGTTRQVSNIKLAQYGSLARVVKVMALMGNGVLRSVTDISTALAEARFQGIPIGLFIHNTLKNFFGGLGKGEKEAAHMMGIGIESSVADLMSRLGMGGGIPGNMSRLARTYFRANFMTMWNDSLKVMSHSLMSQNLGNKAKTSFKDLDFETDRLLKLFDIEDSDWDLVRSTVTTTDGVNRITSDQIQNIPDKVIAKHLSKFKSGKTTEIGTFKDKLIERDFKESIPKERIDAFRDDLETKVGTMFIDRNDSFITVPGAREKAIFHQGTQRGDIIGEILRTIMTFKTFPVTIALRPLNTLTANIKQRGRPEDFYALAEFITGMTVLGYVGQSAIDISQGKEPRTDFPGAMLDAMIKGGAFALYGDAILSQYEDPGRFDALKQIAGPVFGSFKDIASVTASAMRGEDKGKQAFNIAISWMPFANMFYYKAALDAAVFKNMQEWFDPGSLRKQERALKKRTGQEFFAKQSRIVPRGGGNPLDNLSRLGEEIIK